jgi:hypothetical protein
MKTKNKILTLLSCILIFFSCEKESSTSPSSSSTNAVIPTVSTSVASNITTNSVSTGGNVTDDGGADITERGICWSTSKNPSTSDNKQSSGTGKGTFNVNISNLQENTVYFARAYAKNSKGTAYGNEISFTTEVYTPPSTAKIKVIVNITDQAWNNDCERDKDIKIELWDPSSNTRFKSFTDPAQQFSYTFANISQAGTYEIELYTRKTGTTQWGIWTSNTVYVSVSGSQISSASIITKSITLTSSDLCY